MIYIQSKISANMLTVESDFPLENIKIYDAENIQVNADVIYKKEENGKFYTAFDGSNLKKWSPNHPELYTLIADNVSQRFGYCELSTLDNRAVMLNGTPCYLRGCIRGIVAHDHPNMTGGTLKDAAVKYIRQAKKYGFNLVRFHSTIPPVEFVEAADEEGFLIHMEIGFASYERLFVKSCLQKNVKKVDNQRKMIPKRYAFVLLLFAFCNASAESDA
ncbi:MAG: hypothetical protein IKA22_02030, partial [Lentisphaeria bacterium]|nr:hypothetical protein [Lentisphaeria bacterium]